MARIVVKFGGTSVAGIPQIENAAAKVAAEIARGHQVAVVVSAMSGVTNQLIEYCREISPLHDAREYDAVVASGENVTSGLMALALQKRGIQARSWQGWQIPILCSDVHGKARILEIDGTEIARRMDNDNEVAVIAGFQGVTSRQRVTTLGRGGSDTTAVALAAALQAERCDIYTDVNGVYTADPRIVQHARKLKKISYEEMYELASSGSKVLMTRSVEMAMKMNVPVQVLSTFEEPIGSDYPGTLVTRDEDIVEQEVVNGVAHSKDEAKVTLVKVPDIPGIAAGVFGPLAEANINVDMIVQNVSQDGKTDMTFTVSKAELQRAMQVLKNEPRLAGIEIRFDEDVAKISVVGIGMKSHAGVAQTMFTALAERGINIQVISTSEIKISVLIAAEYTELAVRALHAAYGLEGDRKLA
ncbi:MAG: aspartate kinase [Alphaproteobacteria bacterium]|nr:aspartate kinase [Alphaproteobacteria bacterium]